MCSSDLDKLTQDLLLAAEGLDLARRQNDFQDLINRESVRNELLGMATDEERRRLIREFEEVTVALNDLAIDRKGNDIRRSRVQVQADDNEIQREVERLEMVRRLDQARTREEEQVVLAELDERGYLRDERREILQEQLDQRRQLRASGNEHELEKTGLIQRQALPLMEIDQIGRAHV